MYLVNASELTVNKSKDLVMVFSAPCQSQLDVLMTLGNKLEGFCPESREAEGTC